MTAATTTATITSVFGTAANLAAFATDAFAVAIDTDGNFTLTFTDADAATAAVEAAKVAAFRTYLRGGGNARNKRAFGSSFAGAKKAIAKAVAA